MPSRAIPYVITPERRAMLSTIRFAEGTWKGGLDVGYRVMFGGGLMPSLDRHPNRVIYRSRYASAAAGAYQFMPFTWNLVQRSIGVRGFGPEAQDQGALFLIQRRKALSLTDADTHPSAHGHAGSRMGILPDPFRSKFLWAARQEVFPSSLLL